MVVSTVWNFTPGLSGSLFQLGCLISCTLHPSVQNLLLFSTMAAPTGSPALPQRALEPLGMGAKRRKSLSLAPFKELCPRSQCCLCMGLARLALVSDSNPPACCIWDETTPQVRWRVAHGHQPGLLLPFSQELQRSLPVTK